MTSPPNRHAFDPIKRDWPVLRHAAMTSRCLLAVVPQQAIAASAAIARPILISCGLWAVSSPTLSVPRMDLRCPTHSATTQFASPDRAPLSRVAAAAELAPIQQAATQQAATQQAAEKDGEKAPQTAANEAAGKAAENDDELDTLVATLELLVAADVDATRQCLRLLADKTQARELEEVRRARLAKSIGPLIDSLLKRPVNDPLRCDAAILAASLRREAGRTPTRATAADQKSEFETRRRALAALIAARDPLALEIAEGWLASGNIANGGQAATAGTAAGTATAGTATAGEAAAAPDWPAAALALLGRMDQPRVAEIVLRRYRSFSEETRPKAIELLTQRPAWSVTLLDAIARREIPSAALNANQVARLLVAGDESLRQRVLATWGSVRTERNPQREQVIARVRESLRAAPGEPRQGQAVFRKVCGQCHKIHGEGQEVGPDITANGRSNLEQLLSNVLDPSLVIGASYQARVVLTADGRALTGLLVEDSPQRVVLKTQGGKQEVVARGDVEEVRISPLSLMPEGLETQLSPTELSDLFAFLRLDLPPDNPRARLIPDR